MRPAGQVKRYHDFLPPISAEFYSRSADRCPIGRQSRAETAPPRGADGPCPSQACAALPAGAAEPPPSSCTTGADSDNGPSRFCLCSPHSRACPGACSRWVFCIASCAHLRVVGPAAGIVPWRGCLRELVRPAPVPEPSKGVGNANSILPHAAGLLVLERPGHLGQQLG